MKSIKKAFVNIPTPLAGLALGIASLGWALENLGFFHGIMQELGATIAAVLLLMVIIKFIQHPSLLWQDLSHPVLGSIVPTSSMCLMVISKVITSHYHLNAIIWLIAVVAHISFLMTFVYHRARDFQWQHKVPAWFVPPVGIIVASLTYPSASFHSLANIILLFGMLSYTVLLPTMLYRLIFHPTIDIAAQPTIAILAAPASLSLAGYLTVVNQPEPEIVLLLAGIAILMTLTIYFAFFKLLRLSFSPGYAAFTFPMVIGATAMFKLSDWMSGFGFATQYVHHVHVVAVVELCIAVFIVGYVAIRYSWHYSQFIGNNHYTVDKHASR